MSPAARLRTSERDFALLEPRVKQVSEATVRKKWKRLPTSNHSAAREAIYSAKQQSRTRKGRGGIDLATEDCIQEITTRLIDRLPRIPFPPATDEHHFDHEANLHRVGRVEAQLNASVHSMSLLKAQIAKEEQLLSQDEAEVKHLEQSLRSREAHRRELSKTLHSSARILGQDYHNPNLIASQDESRRELAPSLAGLLEDEEMQPVLEQLYGHLLTMDSNISVIRGIRQGVDSVGTELQTYTLQRLKSRNDGEA